jgi:hypothetical protein
MDKINSIPYSFICGPAIKMAKTTNFYPWGELFYRLCKDEIQMPLTAKYRLTCIVWPTFPNVQATNT